MAERPILFSDEMVRAILDGRKTMTRRVVKLRDFMDSETRGYDWTFRDKQMRWHDVSNERLLQRYCRYGVPGDLLWVKECHQLATGHMYDGEAAVRHRADGAIRAIHDDRSNDAPRSLPLSGRWRPSILMPRWASRILLRVTDVRVERVQDISDKDALSEGIDETREYEIAEHLATAAECNMSAERLAFARLWDSINAARGFGWDANPWVWVVSFEVVQLGQETEVDE